MNAGDDARWRELRALFDEVVELPEAERRAALEQACGGDPGRIAEVLALVQAAERGDRFLVPPARETPAARDVKTRVGHYILERVLGRGRQGTVHLARDERDGTALALRIASLDEHAAEAVARLRRLAPLLARLDHPGLARVLETGLCARPGKPEESALYFAAELVTGAVPLVEVDDSPRGRLGFFLDACDAVAHAHAAGIQHGALTAANVVVDSAAHLRVLDLGVRSVLWAGAPPSVAGDRIALAELLSELLRTAAPERGDWITRARALAQATRTEVAGELASVAGFASRLRNETAG